MQDARSPTEWANPASSGIDAKTIAEVLRIIHEEDHQAWKAVGGALGTIEHVVRSVVNAFRCGGRLLYLGAGTSGRLGVLDASECPPTFGVPHDLVQAFIAGGDAAIRQSVEEAEDSHESGVQQVAKARVRGRDVVCGIAASGNTPFVWGGLEEAMRRDATTVLVSGNPEPSDRWPFEMLDHRVTLEVGPEVIAGSTRMKCGTATKMALNMITTGAMIRLGKVYDNLMVDVIPSNHKLRLRAQGLVRTLAGVSSEEADALLEAGGMRVKVAVLLARGCPSAEEAEKRLSESDDNLRQALEGLRGDN